MAFDFNLAKMKRISLSLLSDKALSHQQEDALKGGFNCACCCSYICTCPCSGMSDMNSITQSDEISNLDQNRSTNAVKDQMPQIEEPGIPFGQ